MFPDDNTFTNEFDLTESSLDELEIRETKDKKKCFIWHINIANKAYNSFILSKNSQSKVICELSIHKSSKTEKYLPRPIFKRLKLDGSEQFSKSEKSVIVSLSTSDDAIQFWNLIGFLNSYKEIVEVGSFEETFKVISKDSYILEFKDKSELQRLEDLKELVNLADLSTSDIKSLTFENRKKNLKGFFRLLKNHEVEPNLNVHQYYKNKYELNRGEEDIWHHFLKRHDWILGLNVDIKFVAEFLDEQKVGTSDSIGRKNPQTDLLGISEFTVLIELKHSNTDIFKKTKSKGRANTWDFTSDFIEGISQCLGQKFELDKFFDSTDFITTDKTRFDKSTSQSIDPKSILLIGNKKREFPINYRDDTNLTKNKTLERFRRNNRNVDVLTYDELFERAYHIVYSRKLDKEWYWKDENELFN